MSRTSKGLAPLPVTHRDLGPVYRWPPPDYWTRGPPRRIDSKFTTSGYVVTLVRQPGGHYTQEPRPPAEVPARPRSDACLVRPERSLSVSQIMAGEYFARPDPAAFLRILDNQKAAANSKVAASAKPLPPVGAETTTFDGSKIWDGLDNTVAATSLTASDRLASTLQSVA